MRLAGVSVREENVAALAALLYAAGFEDTGDALLVRLTPSKLSLLCRSPIERRSCECSMIRPPASRSCAVCSSPTTRAQCAKGSCNQDGDPGLALQPVGLPRSCRVEVSKSVFPTALLRSMPPTRTRLRRSATRSAVAASCGESLPGAMACRSSCGLHSSRNLRRAVPPRRPRAELGCVCSCSPLTSRGRAEETRS